ncbi:Bacterial type II/III secretion system short domain protein [Planctomycetes bacterium MalM25]|nr:Bacterial type II/III secretion system short domain protein [Planctomycetes bacterium MalM25]
MPSHRRKEYVLISTAWLCALLLMSPAAAQQFSASPGGPNVVVQRSGRPKPANAKPSNNKANDSKKQEEAKGEKPDDKEKKEGGSEDEEKKPDDGPTQRPNKPPTPPDPRELEAKPDSAGRVTFSFHGQAWGDVLQWLANVSELSLDWRELPGDYLNLTTQRAYSLPEARDLINRHLQARGYTLLLSGEVLSVFKLDQLDPSLVPRATEEELYDRLPHDVVKVSLAVPEGYDAKQTLEDVKQALSPHAKAMPLTATKRLLLIDTVANLRMVSALLNEERLAVEGRAAPREFVLEHVQASEVIDIVYVVLGLDPNSRPSQMELQMQQQKMQLMNQLAQRGKDVMKLLQKDGPPVYLAYNRQRNSVLANAPPEQMRIIARTIEALDVPTSEGGADVASAGERRLEQYRLKTISPTAVISALEEIGGLSPRAELRGDKDSKTLFARASARDHEKITSLIDQLDGAETVVEVFWLRRLPAEAVAGSIQSLIINKPKKKKKDNDYPFFFSYRRNNDDDDEPETLLRVDADIENNRLIVRGTPQQLEEVRDLLVKLGEPIGDRADERRVRVLDTLDPDKTEQLLRQLKAAWPSVGGETELILPAEEQEDPAESEVNPTEARTAQGTVGGSRFRLLSDHGEDEKSAPSATKPPVAIRVDPRGRLVISSDDTAALGRLEELIAELIPEPDRYKVFPVKVRNPDDLVDSLRVYFEEFLAEDDEQVLDWWGRVRGVKSEEDEPVRLSRRRPLRFLADDRSSTILVANATSAQLTEIGKLIETWDRKPSTDRIYNRRTVTMKLRYAQASNVVAALKEVYRDLLSRGDKEFDTEEKKAAGSIYSYLTKIHYGEGESTDPAFIGFDGLLSLGADDEANVIIVSAREEVFGSVVDAIRQLDEQSRPTQSVQVLSLANSGATEDIRRALLRAIGESRDGSDRDRSRDRDRGDDRRRSRGR